MKGLHLRKLNLFLSLTVPASKKESRNQRAYRRFFPFFPFVECSANQVPRKAVMVIIQSNVIHASWIIANEQRVIGELNQRNSNLELKKRTTNHCKRLNHFVNLFCRTILKLSRHHSTISRRKALIC